ncbi:hypothetical protein HUG17_8828 [Dermatophagoides farinae]|uniref:Superoxide dismutase n=1 Tax=Dermatophagoides farinae TaxID=6954 RepID=A0A9D4NSF9_DERFA|nr:copper chaperone for superoxide dismutase, chloroplastic/cytosolic-like isoform X1 [Dermatophagoides farinae]KAH7637724.1 hypothetical protein HUG17_8828 [Dermatophagoides farinae]
MSVASDFSFQVEFAVLMKCDACRVKIINELNNLSSVQIDEISVANQRLVLRLNESSPSAFEIQNLLEKKLRLNTIIRGTGDFIAAVGEIRGSANYPNVFGVARFVQNEHKQCLFDAVIDGFKDSSSSSSYNVGIHEYGDLSDTDLKSIGSEVFNIATNVQPIDGQLLVKKKIENIDISTKIGQSLAISSNNVNGDIIAASVIARASKILNNTKKVCACSGKTLWEERETENRKHL